MMKNAFYYHQQNLFCENLNLTDFAQERPTPFFIYSKQEITSSCKLINEIGGTTDFLPCYALKANFNPTLLRLIAANGFGADVVSGGELYFALQCGFPPESIVFAGVGKTVAEIEMALEVGIHSLNVESAGELEIISQISARIQKNARIAIRVNPDIEAQTHHYISTGLHTTKFGVTADEALQMYLRAKDDRWLKPTGIHVHIGSQITQQTPYLATVEFLKQFVKRLGDHGIHLNYLDLGGGIGINYHNTFQEANVASGYIEEILPAYLNGLRDLKLRLIVEPGRAVIGSSALLVSRVLYRKETPQKKFLIVDAAMNNLIRPSLYNAYHEIVPLHLHDTKNEVCDVVGPVCESSDFLAKDRPLQPMMQGETLAVVGAGAYGQSLSSNYNLRPRIAEYLVDGDRVTTITEAETLQELGKKIGI
jgi:diaminopimelate decarboxylase